MRRHRHSALRPFICGATVLAFAGNAARAQSVSAHSVIARASTAEQAALFGGGVTLGTTLSSGALHLQLRGEAMRGSRYRTASACTGLVPPNTTLCDPQRLRTMTQLELGSLGVRAPLLRAKRMEFSVVGALGLARIGTSSRDSTQRERLSARRLMFVPEAGVDWRWQPSKRMPVALNVGAAASSIRPFGGSLVVDGYDPFDSPLRFRRAWVGVAYSLHQ